MLSISEFLQQHQGEVLRLIVLNSHYRSPLAFSSEIAEAAAKGLERLRTALRPAENGPLGEGGPAEQDLAQAVATAEANFEAAMDDDFNTPQALSSLYELVRSTNLARDKGAGQPALQLAQQKLQQLAGVLGLRLVDRAPADPRLGGMVDLLVEIREELRAAEQWELADRIRLRLASQGIQLEDGKHGTSWRQD